MFIFWEIWGVQNHSCLQASWWNAIWSSCMWSGDSSSKSSRLLGFLPTGTRSLWCPCGECSSVSDPGCIAPDFPATFKSAYELSFPSMNSVFFSSPWNLGTFRSLKKTVLASCACQWVVSHYGPAGNPSCLWEILVWGRGESRWGISWVRVGGRDLSHSLHRRDGLHCLCRRRLAC